MTGASRSQQEINQGWLSTEHLLEGIGGRTARGGAIAIASQLVRFVVQLGTTFILARLLIPEHFGIIAIGGTVLAFILLFTELGVSTATVQVRRLDQDTASAFLVVNIVLTLLAVTAAWLASPLIAWLFRDARVPGVVIGLALSAPIGALGSIHFALLMRNMKWLSMQFLNVGSLALGSIAGVLSAWLLDFGYWALVVQSLVSASSSTIASWFICGWRPSSVRDWSGARAALGFGLNLNASMFLNFAHRQLDNALIGWRWGSTELGFYSRAYNLLLTPLNLVTGPLGTAIIPALSRLHGEDEHDKWRTGYLDALIIVTMIGGFLTAILFGGAVPIIEFVFGPGWGETQIIFSYLVIAMLGATAMNTSSWIYVSRGRTDRMLLYSLVAAPIYVLSFIIGLPYGAEGVALVYAVAQLLTFLPCFWMATRFTNLTMGDIFNAVAPSLVITVIVGALLRLAVAASPVFLLDVAVIAAACFLFIGLSLLAIRVWPPYRRVYERARRVARGAIARLGLGQANSGRLV